MVDRKTTGIFVGAIIALASLGAASVATAHTAQWQTSITATADSTRASACLSYSLLTPVYPCGEYRIVGRVSSPGGDAACINNREVRIYRVGGEWVGSDSTDELGRYDATVEGWSVLPGGPPRGAFYASAPASRVATRAHKHVCKTGTSGQVKFLGAR